MTKKPAPYKLLTKNEFVPLPLTHRARAYTPTDHTNVQETWKLFGWQPTKRPNHY